MMAVCDLYLFLTQNDPFPLLLSLHMFLFTNYREFKVIQFENVQSNEEISNKMSAKTTFRICSVVCIFRIIKLSKLVWIYIVKPFVRDESVQRDYLADVYFFFDFIRIVPSNTRCSAGVSKEILIIKRLKICKIFLFRLILVPPRFILNYVHVN